MRRKFLRWSGLGSLVLLTGFSFRKLFSSKKDILSCAPEVNTIKMLTQDGQLVEIDVTKIAHSKKAKITDDQLKNWVNKKQG